MRRRLLDLDAKARSDRARRLALDQHVRSDYAATARASPSLDAAPLAFAARELDDRLRATPGRRAPGAKGRLDPDDDEIAVEKACVDREAHEERELKLGKKESDLAQYVGQLQTQMDQRESDWWQKQLVKPVAAGGN